MDEVGLMEYILGQWGPAGLVIIVLVLQVRNLQSALYRKDHEAITKRLVTLENHSAAVERALVKNGAWKEPQ